MRSMAKLAMAMLAAMTAAVAQAGGAGFDPRLLKDDVPGQPNQVMVLGTAHISGWPDGFDPALLTPLIDRLAAWKPTIIAVESLSGAQCDMLRRHPARYAASVDNYCWDPAPARAATGLDVPAANAEAEKLLAHWPAAPAPAQRRRLAALFLAAGNRIRRWCNGFGLTPPNAMRAKGWTRHWRRGSKSCRPDGMKPR